MRAPKFNWVGSTESKSGTAIFSCGGNVIEIEFDDFVKAQKAFWFIRDAWVIGYNDGTAEVARAVRKAVGEVIQDGL